MERPPFGKQQRCLRYGTFDRKLLEIHIERIAYEHFDILEDDDFDEFVAGGKLMIRDVKEMLANEQQAFDYVRNIIAEEVEKEEESPLINQILETSKQLKYEQVLRLLQEMQKELNRN